MKHEWFANFIHITLFLVQKIVVVNIKRILHDNFEVMSLNFVYI